MNSGGVFSLATPAARRTSRSATAVAIPTTERSRRLPGSGYAPQQYQVPNVRNGVNSGASHQRQPAAHIRFSPKA